MTAVDALGAWRHRYRLGLGALTILQRGGSHLRSLLFSRARASDGRWIDQFLVRLIRDGLIECVGLSAASNDIYRVRDGRLVNKLLQNERMLCVALDLGEATHAKEASVLLSGSSSIIEQARALQTILPLFGHPLVRERFGIGGRKVLELKALGRYSPAVLERFEALGLSLAHAGALTKAPDDEALQLALLEATGTHALVARELRSIAASVREGASLEDALLAFGVSAQPAAAEDYSEPDGDVDPGAAEVLAACLKATMACLTLVSEMHKKVDFLARELGYKEESLADTG